MEKDKVAEYLLVEKGNNAQVAKVLYAKVSKYDDIYQEFLQWLDTRNYDFVEPVKSGEYSAADIMKMAPFLDGIGVYNFLVTLRDNPDFAYKTIADGFVIK